MAEARCVYVDIDVESFDQRVLDAVKKNLTIEQIFHSIEILKKYQIEPEINILLGATPLESVESIKKTITTVEKLNVDYVLYSIATPFPGTDFYYQAKQNRWFANSTNEYTPTDPAQKAIISYPNLTKQQLENLLSYAYRKHYFNLCYIFKQLIKVRSLRDFYNKFITAVKAFKRNILMIK